VSEELIPGFDEAAEPETVDLLGSIRVMEFELIGLEALLEIQARLTAQIALVRQQVITDVRQEVLKQAELLGVSPSELLGLTPPGGATGKVIPAEDYHDPDCGTGPVVFAAGGKVEAVIKPVYVNPHDTSQTWSGRGKRPVWFKMLVDQHGEPEAKAMCLQGAAEII